MYCKLHLLIIKVLKFTQADVCILSSFLFLIQFSRILGFCFCFCFPQLVYCLLFLGLGIVTLRNLHQYWITYNNQLKNQHIPHFKMPFTEKKNLLSHNVLWNNCLPEGIWLKGVAPLYLGDSTDHFLFSKAVEATESVPKEKENDTTPLIIWLFIYESISIPN